MADASTPYIGRAMKRVEDPRLVRSIGWHEGIEKGEFCMYRACEWGQIRRTQDSGRDVKVVSKRAAIATQAIIVRGDSPCNVPQDLRGRTVAVNFHAGSHYITLSMLGGAMNAKSDVRPSVNARASSFMSSASAASRTPALGYGPRSSPPAGGRGAGPSGQ